LAPATALDTVLPDRGKQWAFVMPNGGKLRLGHLSRVAPDLGCLALNISRFEIRL
jgi:hypothetical protein